MITLDEFKKYLKIDLSDTSKDNQLNLAILNASWLLEWYIWYSLALDESKVAFFNWRWDTFELKDTKINSISTIKYWEDEFDDSLTTYSWKKKVYEARWLIKTQEEIWDVVEITYSFWYDETTCPVDLKMAFYEMSATSYKNMWEVSMWDLKSESVDWDSVTFKDFTWKISENARIILNKYKRYDFSS